jgi:hypothetical protein
LAALHDAKRKKACECGKSEDQRGLTPGVVRRRAGQLVHGLVLQAFRVTVDLGCEAANKIGGDRRFPREIVRREPHRVGEMTRKAGAGADLPVEQILDVVGDARGGCGCRLFCLFGCVSRHIGCSGEGLIGSVADILFFFAGARCAFRFACRHW